MNEIGAIDLYLNRIEIVEISSKLVLYKNLGT